MDTAKKINLFALAGSHSINSFYMHFLIPVIPLIVFEFGLSYAQAGLIVSAYAVANSVFQFPLSFASDYTGRWRTVLALSLFTQALPVLLYGYASNYSLLLLFVFISGIGSAAYHPSAVSLITQELPDRRGLCMGYFYAGGMAGIIITPVLVTWLAVHLDSWRTAAQIFVVPGVIWAGFIWIQFKDSNITRRPFREAARTTFRALLLNRSLVLLVLLSSCRIMSLRGFAAFLPLLLVQEFGFDIKGMGWVLTSYYIIGTGASFLISRWSDGRSRPLIIVVLTPLCALIMAAIPWIFSTPVFLATLAVFGCLYMALPSLVLAVGTELVGERERSSSIGFIYSVNEGASSFSPVIGGLIAEAVGLRLSFLFFSFILFFGTLVAYRLYRESELRPATIAGEAV